MGKVYSGHLWISKSPMTLSIYMVCGKCKECMEFRLNLLKAVQCFYVDSRACVFGK